MDNDLSEDDLLRLAASVESASEHPLGEALVAEAGNRGLTLQTPEKFNAKAGLGVQAIIDGKDVAIGNQRLIAELGIDPKPAEEHLVSIEDQAQTAIILVVDGKLTGLFGVADSIKAGSREAIDRLKSLGLTLVMLTGDNQRTAQVIAEQVGMDDVVAEVLPNDKVKHVKRPAGRRPYRCHGWGWRQ